MKNLMIILSFVFTVLSLNAQDSDRPLINTRGTATVYAIPNEALINFSIITHSNELADAKRKNGAISIETINYLKSRNIEEKHIQTQYLNIGRNYRWDRNPQVEKKYIATQSFSVCISNLDHLESIISDLLQMEISNLSTPNFRTTEIKKYKDQARKKAIANAKYKAELLAGELEQTVGRAHRISEVTFNNTGERFAYANFAEDASISSGGQDSFAIGQLEVKAEIDVSFNLQ